MLLMRHDHRRSLVSARTLRRKPSDTKSGGWAAPPGPRPRRGHRRAAATTYTPALRRTAALLLPGLNDHLRPAYGAEVARTVAALAGPGGTAVKLTPSEERVLEALRRSGTLPEVAERLFVSRNTLKTHLRRLYAKLHVASREEAIAVASSLGLLGNDEGP